MEEKKNNMLTVTHADCSQSPPVLYYALAAQTDTDNRQTHSRNSILVVWLGKFYLKCVVVVWWSGWQRGRGQGVGESSQRGQSGSDTVKRSMSHRTGCTVGTAGSGSLPQSISETALAPSSWAEFVRTAVQQRHLSASSKRQRRRRCRFPPHVRNHSSR